MAKVSVKNLKKKFSETVAVNGISLDVADGEFLTVVGPSGCGKTTLLRLIAGLETPTAGDISIGGQNMAGIAPARRHIAMVFQNDALYPHMDVYKNIVVGMARQGVTQHDIDARVREAADTLDIADLLTRRPGELSGGQRQRAALARAMVRDPAVFLLDEPLSDLDAVMRDDLRAAIIALHAKLNATFIYVTHDQTEALTMGNRLAVMRAGNLEQVAPPRTIYNQPRNLFVAGFVGSKMNFLDCALHAGRAEVCGFIFPAVRGETWPSNIVAGIRAEHVRLCESTQTGVPAKVLMGEIAGASMYLHTECCGARIVAAVKPDFAYAAGQMVKLRFQTENMLFFNKDTGESLT